MRQKEIINKLSQGCYIEWSEIGHFRRIFLYNKDGSSWLAQINIKSFNALWDKGILDIYENDTKSLDSGIYTISRLRKRYRLKLIQ